MGFEQENIARNFDYSGLCTLIGGHWSPIKSSIACRFKIKGLMLQKNALWDEIKRSYNQSDINIYILGLSNRDHCIF